MTWAQPGLVLDINKEYPKICGRTLLVVRGSSPGTMIVIASQGHDVCRNTIKSLGITKPYYYYS